MGYPPQIGSGDKMAKTHPTRPIAQYTSACRDRNTKWLGNDSYGVGRVGEQYYITFLSTATSRPYTPPEVIITYEGSNGPRKRVLTLGNTT